MIGEREVKEERTWFFGPWETRLSPSSKYIHRGRETDEEASLGLGEFQPQGGTLRPSCKAARQDQPQDGPRVETIHHRAMTKLRGHRRGRKRQDRARDPALGGSALSPSITAASGRAAEPAPRRVVYVIHQRVSPDSVSGMVS